MWVLYNTKIEVPAKDSYEAVCIAKDILIHGNTIKLTKDQISMVNMYVDSAYDKHLTDIEIEKRFEDGLYCVNGLARGEEFEGICESLEDDFLNDCKPVCDYGCTNCTHKHRCKQL